MHYVKHFKINGVDTKQVACIELQSKPNTATEGAAGLLGIDMSSPLHEIYKCVAVNGSIYTWELFSSGLSIVSATMSGGGEQSVSFPYDSLKTPLTYAVKPGDLILDRGGYLYQIDSLGAVACDTTYCGTQVVAYGKSAYDLAVERGFEGSVDDWLLTLSGERSVYPFEARSTDGVSYGATVAGVTELYNGLTITVVPNMTSKEADINLDLNGLGAKAVRMTSSVSSGSEGVSVTKEDWFTEGAPITLRYNADLGIWKTDLQIPSVENLQGILSISKGGTGASDVATALKNLGATHMESGYYKGSGSSGSSSPTKAILTKGKLPWLFVLMPNGISDRNSSSSGKGLDPNEPLIYMVVGNDKYSTTNVVTTNGTGTLHIRANTERVEWYVSAGGSTAQRNSQGVWYYWMAFYQG